MKDKKRLAEEARLRSLLGQSFDETYYDPKPLIRSTLDHPRVSHVPARPKFCRSKEGRGADL